MDRARTKTAANPPVFVRSEEYEHFTKFKTAAWRRYQHGRHLDLLDREILEVESFIRTEGKEGNGFLLVEMPPRFGKTQSLSRLLPPWFLGRNPDRRVILASYGAKLAEKNSRYARAVIRTELYQRTFPGIELAKDSKAVDYWDLEGYEGGCSAVGVDGPVTGTGGDLIVCDDLHKGRKEAESQLIRDNTWDWFTDDLYTRRNSESSGIIVVGTRWHTDDVPGRLELRQKDKWRVLRLPALAEENDQMGRAIDEPLWPERFSLAFLLDVRKSLGEYSWNAEYQQRPIASEGGLFKRAKFNIIQRAPEVVQAVRFWDLAMSSKTSADYSVGVKMGQAVNGRLVVLDVVRRRVEWDQLAALMADTALMDGPDVRIGFEQQGYMSRAGQALALDPRLHNYAIWGYIKDKDKFTNALPYAARCGLNLVDVMDGYFTNDYLDELCSFPLGAHDDQVDASAGAYDMLDRDAATESGMNYAESEGFSSSDY